MEPPVPIDSPAGVHAYAEWLRLRRRQRSRRRAAVLAAFLSLGLALGTIWASGFATTSGTIGTANKPTPLFADPGNKQDTSGLNGLITSGGNLSWSWQGQWGSVASKAMYTVDLDSLSSGKYYVGVYLTNVPTGFADLQLQLRIADVGKEGTCNAAAIEAVSTKSDYRIFTFEAVDAQVTFSGMSGSVTGLPAEKTYCIGIANYPGSGQDPEGTFIRKASKGGTFTGTYPTFVATLNQME